MAGIPIPNLNLNSTAEGRAQNSFAGASQAWGSGAWNVNLGGTGAANFSANASAAAPSTLGAPVAGIPAWALALGAVVVVAWLLN